MVHYSDIVTDLGWIPLLFPWGQLQHFAFPKSLWKGRYALFKGVSYSEKKSLKESMHLYKPASNITPCGYV